MLLMGWLKCLALLLVPKTINIIGVRVAIPGQLKQSYILSINKGQGSHED